MKTKPVTKNKKKAVPRKKRSTAPTSGLSGYLVVWRHTLDDIPVGLYATEQDAIKVAKTMTWTQGYLRARRLNIDCSTPVCFAYTVFKNGAATDFVIVDRKDDA
jgi:hypothetical protein